MSTERKTMSLEKVEQLENQMREQVKFYLNSPERVVEALVFVRKMTDFIEEIKEYAKKRGHEMMQDQNVSEVVLDGWKIQEFPPTMTKKYSVNSVIEGLGMERAIAFLEVKSGALEKYAVKALRQGAMTYPEMEICQKAMKSMPRKGYIKLTEIKEKK